MNRKDYNSNWKKLLGFRKMQEKLEKQIPTSIKLVLPNSKSVGTLLVGSSESVLPLQTVIMKIMIANFAWQSSSNCLQWQLW